MKIILREEKSGVAEVVGTILILAMTVVLFSVVIAWVSSIPTPEAQTRVDLSATMQPIYDIRGTEIGVNINITHEGGELFQPVATMIYVTSVRGSTPPTTDRATLHLFNSRLANPSGLLDGSDSIWNIGERWAYQNYQFRSSDAITVTIVDTGKGLVVWSGPMNPRPGTRPPIFVNLWTDGVPSTLAPDPVQATLGFTAYAQVTDPDGDVNPASVYGTITPWYGSGTICATPIQMRDDGVPPDRVAGDGIYSLGGSVCTNSPYPPLSWAGSLLLFNATDMKGHMTTTRLVLNVVPQTSGFSANLTSIPSQLWQYIGFVQVRAEDVWITNMGDPVNTANRFQPYRITRDTLNQNGGALFHLSMANHGNRTVFVDGWTLMSFSKQTSASVFGMFIVKPVDVTRPANAGGVAAYPGIATDPNNFQYAQVFDIDPFNQEKGGAPTVALFAAKTPFRNDWPLNFITNNLFVNVLVSGMMGPVNMTYQQILNRWGPTYNPFTHVNDVDPSTRTVWYAQVIPFIGMTVY